MIYAKLSTMKWGLVSRSDHEIRVSHRFRLRTVAISVLVMVVVTLLPIAGIAKPTKRIPPVPGDHSGSLVVSGDMTYGGELAVTAEWANLPYPLLVLQVLCQSADTSVVYAEAVGPTVSPFTHTFTLGIPDPERGTSVWDGSFPVSCRVDLMNQFYNEKPLLYEVIYLDTERFDVA